MAVTAGTVNVNNDNTGWSSADVMTALETVFSNLGMHGGTSKTGVPICCKWPGQTDSQPAQTQCNSIVSNSHPSGTEFSHAGKNDAPWDAKEMCPVGSHLANYENGEKLLVNN